MKKLPRRLQLRRLTTRAAGAIRRRPRTATVGLTLSVVAAIVIGGSLILVNGRSAPAETASSAPTFTYAGGWTLVELERHLVAGDVAAISASHSSSAADGAPDVLVVRTRDGQVIPIDLAVSAGEAVSALSGLGYGGLLTTEALAASRANGADNAANPLAIILPILMLLGTIVMITRISRRNGPSARELSSGFSTIMPADPNARPTGDVVPDPSIRAVASLDDVAGCDEAKLELTETIEFLRTPGALPPARRPDPARDHALRPARHRQDDARPRRRRRGRRPVPLRVGLGVRREVRRRRREARSATCSPRPASSAAA